jgi:hypothetical protein
MAGTQHIINFNSGNPFSVGPAGIRSAAVVLPPTVTSVTLAVLDPNGDWVNPANAGASFTFGVEASADGGATWHTLVAGTDAVGHLAKGNALPTVALSARTTNLGEVSALTADGARWTIIITDTSSLVVGERVTTVDFVPAIYNGTRPIASIVDSQQLTVAVPAQPGPITTFGSLLSFGILEAYGLPCRAFAVCSQPISIAARATVVD